MGLALGTRLGPYEILAPIGAGGMGEVYRAHDPRMGRDVAIKVCAERFSERFDREVRAVAALNHPNICHLYDVGPNYLVMELVEGPTLAERIKQGAVPLDEALGIAKQIADALEAAHEQRIVHRDLKPANIKIRPDGTVKVLDFGLAQTTDTADASGRTENSPTLTLDAVATRMGAVLGTAAYMPPEQARGKRVDKRADIWAFGVVLYEMLTGERLFEGETVSDTLIEVATKEPDWKRIPAKPGKNVQLLLRRCLVKDPTCRLRDIGDAMPLLHSALEVAPSRRPWVWIALAAALAIAFSVAAVGWWRATGPAPLHPLVRLSAQLPPGMEIPNNGSGELALSPDGMRLAIVEQDEAGTNHLATRRLDEDQFLPLPGTEGATNPFFSPDGQWLGFFADGRLKKIAVQGGSPATLCDAPGARTGSWGDDGSIIAALKGGTAGLSRISSGGGSPTPVIDIEKGESVSHPQVLPGSKAVLFTTLASGGSPDDAEIAVVSFSTGQRRILQRNGFFARYLASGHLVYMHQGTLYAAPFDLNRLAVTGASQPLLEDVRLVGLSPSAYFDCSQTGTCVYLSGDAERSQAIFWLDSAGKTEPLQPAQAGTAFPRFSPDGKWLAFTMGTGQARQHDVWLKDLGGNTISRLTRMPGLNSQLVWTPDGTSLVFESILGVFPTLYWVRTDGAGEAQRLTEDKIRRLPNSFSPDGKWLVYSQQGAGGQSEIWTAPVERDSNRVRLGKPELFLRTPYSIFSPKFSPDGRWMAYMSNETGRFEVYVRPFPGPGRNRPISIDGGWYPIWSRNRQELFFLSTDSRIMVARYTTNGNSFVSGEPQLWSEKRLLRMPVQSYDLAPDGRRFAVVLAVDGTAEPMAKLTVLMNFFDELRRRVPLPK